MMEETDFWENWQGKDLMNSKNNYSVYHVNTYTALVLMSVCNMPFVQNQFLLLYYIFFQGRFIYCMLCIQTMRFTCVKLEIAEQLWMFSSPDI